jgi:hypothetical protein
MSRKRRLLVACVAAIVAMARESDAQEAPRLLLGLSGAFQTRNPDFRDNVTFLLNAESGDLNADYRAGTGRLFDAEAGARVWRDLVASIDVSYFEKQGRAAVDARLPHPFFFNRHRTVTGEAGAIRRKEIGVHMLAGWLVPLGERLDLLVSGGPSYIRLRQPLVEEVVFTEAFPFDSAAFAGVSTRIVDEGSFGMNAGADLTLRFHRHFGIGSRLRFSRASVTIESADGDRISIDVGGLQVMAGLRARF